MSRDQADVVIVGAGVIGCAIARELALRGMRVIAFDRDAPGRGATWAAAGMLAPLGTADRDSPFLDLADRSLSLYEAWAGALRDETGIDVEYRTGGALHVSLGDADDELCALAATPAAARFDVSLLDADAARKVEPSLSDNITRALFIGREHRVNNRLLAQAVHASCVQAGAAVRAMRPVADVLVDHGHVTGVRLESGERIAAPVVVIAAGAWSGMIGGLPHELPVRPVKGQMFAVDARARAALLPSPSLRHVVLSRGCYIVPREDGRLLVGATVEDVGFEPGPTPRGIAGLMESAAAVVPGIVDLPLVETWAGFRPATTDGLPILGRDAEVEGLVYATGHYRNGILLAPVTAERVAGVVVGEREGEWEGEREFEVARFMGPDLLS